MLKKLALVFLIITCLFSCKTNNAFKYSQDFVAKEKALLPFIETAENKVEAHINAEKYDSVAIEGLQMETRIAKLIDSIKTAPAPDAAEGEKFKVDVIKYFEFMKSVYTTYKNYGSATTDEVRNVYVDKLQEIVAKREQVTNTIQNAQRSFAKANGFKIEK